MFQIASFTGFCRVVTRKSLLDYPIHSTFGRIVKLSFSTLFTFARRRARSVLTLGYSFAHHRVTIPPAGWITAAHRQGVKMLGTLSVKLPDPPILRSVTYPGTWPLSI